MKVGLATSRRHFITFALAQGIDSCRSERSVAGKPGHGSRIGQEHSARPWAGLPYTPEIPETTTKGLVHVNDVTNFYAKFGSGPPVLFLHGGLANSNYWGSQIRALSERFTVIVMDTRGHGRSPLVSTKFSYTEFAKDAIALLKFLNIPKVAVIGWSDGAITGLELAIKNPEIVTGLFAFGANSSVNGVKPNGGKTPIFVEFINRAKREYATLSPQPREWPLLVSGLQAMWRAQPTFTTEEFGKIRLPVTIADGEYDEVIKREDTERMAHEITGAKLLIQRNVSHFALLQRPTEFNADVIGFLSSLS